MANIVICPVCNGSGVIKRKYLFFKVTCPTCNGTGKVQEQTFNEEQIKPDE